MESGSGGRAADPKVRIKKDLYESLWKISNATPRGDGASVTAIIERVLEEWLAKSQQKPSQTHRAAIEPITKDEEVLVDGFLRLLRDRRPVAGPSRDGVLGLIKNWVDKARAARKEENHAS